MWHNRIESIQSNKKLFRKQEVGSITSKFYIWSKKYLAGQVYLSQDNEHKKVNDQHSSRLINKPKLKFILQLES